MSRDAGGELRRSAEALLPHVVALRRRIHALPELGLATPETKRAVLEALAGLDLEIAESRETSGFVATLRGARPGRIVLLRADMDALPMPEDTGLAFSSGLAGRMHACGHDAHTAMLAGAARLLAARRDSLAGTVKLMFQPGEEGYGGARIMLDEGVLDGGGAPDVAFAIHVYPNAPCGAVLSRPGAILASADRVQVVVRGRGGHASMPHHARDPVPVACEIVLALQTAITRRIDVFDPAVLTIARLEAGTAHNVIPETATLEGTMRATSAATREAVRAAVRRVAAGVAAAHDVAADVTIEPGYPVTSNDAAAVEHVARIADDALGSGTFRRMHAPIMGAEDFSYVLERIPGAFAFLGVGPDGDATCDGVAPCHSNRMMLNERALAAGVALHAAVALGLGEPA